MASVLKVDKLDPQSGTALELGTSGDTITVPTGAGLTVTDEVKTNKISPATGTAFALGDSGDTFTVPSGATIVNSGTATGFGITQTSFLPTAAPILVNGNMAISQRATSVTGNTTGGYTTVDRMQMQIGSLGTWTLIQEAQTSGAAFEAGFSNAFRIDCTTADASPAAADYLLFNYVLEGQDVQMFKKGTSAAETYTLAFWVKSNKTGTAQVNLRDDNSRMCSATYTISAGDTWEHKVLNFAADTTGTIDDDNSAGMQLHFWLDAGSDYTGGTAPTAWEAKVATDESANDLALGDSTSNDWAITGIQLEVGEYTSSDLPPFRHESYGDNLARCQRYYETQTGFYWFGFQSGTNVTHNSMASCKVEKRATPSGTYSGSVVNYYPNTGGGNDETNNITAITIGDKNGSTFVGMQSEAGAPTDAGYWPVYADARNAVLNWDAEL